MAARVRKIRHDQETRAKIQTSQLMNRLTLYALGGKDPQTKKMVEMSASQVAAALGLLRKTLPDLAAVEHSGHVTTDPLGEMISRVDGASRGLPGDKPKANGNGRSVH